MKLALIVILGLPIAGVLVFFALGLVSQSGEARGLVDAKLSKCADRPNCICSEFETDVKHYAGPIAFSDTSAPEIMARLKTIINKMGGSIQTENPDYLAATFTSSMFRFVDDLEIRIDEADKKIQLRSASRVGHSDRGVNRKRIKQLKDLYQTSIN